MHTTYEPAPHNHSQHNQCRTPYAVIHILVLLMMGIMMPETCCDRSLIINIGLVVSCWFIPLHPTFHDARSQEPKTVVLIGPYEADFDTPLLISANFFILPIQCLYFPRTHIYVDCLQYFPFQFLYNWLLR